MSVIGDLNNFVATLHYIGHGALSSLIEGDEQLDWPNSQTTMEFCHACVT